MRNFSKFIMTFLLTLCISNCVQADYKVILDAANKAINSINNLGKREINLNYRDGGKVELTGSVSTEQAKTAVEQAVYTVQGVTAIENNLEVVASETNVVILPSKKPKLLSDYEVTENIKNALEQSSDFDLNELNFNVQNGIVTLSGNQVSFRAVDKILSVVLMVDGVKDINNNITVLGKSYPK